MCKGEWGLAMTTSQTKLQVCDLSHRYGQKQILDKIQLQLQEGELVSILGGSGVGKTTLFHLISGLLPPDSGEIILNQEIITGKTGKIAYMLQKDLLLPHKTLLQNIALPLLLQGEKKQRAFDTVRENLETFGLAGYENQYPHTLSGGMCQRAAFLRTYLFSQEVALLDEPFSALDSLTKGELQDWYLQIMEKIKLSTLFITHDMDEAIYLSDRIYLLCGRPAHMVAEVIIKEERPRSKDFCLSPSFIQYKKEIIQLLAENNAHALPKT